LGSKDKGTARLHLFQFSQQLIIGAFLGVNTSTQSMISAREWAWVRWFTSSLLHALEHGTHTRYRVQLHNDGSERSSIFQNLCWVLGGHASEFESVPVRGEKIGFTMVQQF
jgi:hypothetical protein